MQSKPSARLIFLLALLVTTVIAIFPFYWLAFSSFRQPESLFTVDVVPHSLTLTSYSQLFGSSNMLRYFANSVIVAVIVTAITLVVSVCATFSLVFFQYPGRDLFGRLILLTYMFPGVVIVLPLFSIFTAVHLADNIVGLVLAELTLTVPFSVWMLRGFFLDVPKELEEAAIIDGCSKLQVLTRILLPVIQPAIVSVGVIASIFSWNEYLLPLVLLTSDANKTVPLGVAGFMTENAVQWGPLLASGVVAIVPVLVMYMFLQRYLIEGLTAGAVKG